MSVSQTVQFYDIPDIVDAYHNQGVPSFAILHRKQLMFPQEPEDIDAGAAELEALLQMLKKNGSNGIYTLAVYSDVPEKGISSNTPFRASFNFRLCYDPEQRGQYYQGRVGMAPGSYTNALESKIEALTMAVQKLQEDIDTNPGDQHAADPNAGLGQINRFLENPLVKLITDKILGVVTDAVATPTSNYQNARPMLSGVPNNATAAASAAPSVPNLNESLQILRQADPNLDEHLYKLALLSQQNPESFSFLLQTIDRM